MPLADLVELYYRVISPAPYIVCSEVADDLRRVSVRAPAKMTKAALAVLLKTHGYSLRASGGLDVVCGAAAVDAGLSGVMRDPAAVRASLARLPSEEAPMALSAPSTALADPGVPAPAAPIVAAPPPPAAPPARFVHRLDYRQASELLPVLIGLNVGNWAIVGHGVAKSDGSAAANSGMNGGGEALIWSGPKDLEAEARELIADLDTAPPSATVDVAAVAISRTSSQRDALDLVGKVLGVGFDIGTGAGALTIPISGLDVSLDSLATNRQLRVLQRWSGTVRTGKSVSQQTGGSVPVVAAVTESEGGRATQSIEYAPTGLTFRIDPVVLAKEVTLALELQENAVVAGGATPSFETRSISADVATCYGCVSVIARLETVITDRSKDKMFGFLPVSRTARDEKSLVVYVVVVRDKPKAAASVSA